MKTCCSFLLVTALAFTGVAQDTVVPLWPEGVPGAKPDQGAERLEDGRIHNVSTPSLTLYSPAADRSNGTAVIVCPGGGYSWLSAQREGVQYAHWLSTLGITSFVLKYRLVEYGHPAPQQDVLRAIRVVRSRASEFAIDSNRIGVMGSSAGGHLAATAGTLFDHPAGKTNNALDAVSARPDFLILLYPVISMRDPEVHSGSRKALLGGTPSADLVDLLSLDKQVTAATPPTLLIHTQEDQTVSVENSILFFQALTRAKVPAEMYLFERGSHGMGMRTGLGTASSWPAHTEEWLRARGLLDRAR